jgi:hypothetical protein
MEWSAGAWEEKSCHCRKRHERSLFCEGMALFERWKRGGDLRAKNALGSWVSPRGRGQS